MFGRLLMAMLACAPALFEPVAATQSLPRDLSAWSVDYVVIGGIAGITRQVTVASGGSIVVQDRYAADRVEGHVTPDVVAKIAGFLRVARDEKAPTGPPMPDAAGVGLTVTASGRAYALALTPQIAAVLDDAADKAVDDAVVGEWWESAWKLCTPAAQLAAEDIDSPIERLVFEPDGTFTVTWMGGGARTTGLPHVSIPDYRGRYTIQPRSGSIDFRAETGVATPRDFSGRGTLRIKVTQLTLRGVWLGTRAAAKRPDICELTFTKK